MVGCGDLFRSLLENMREGLLNFGSGSMGWLSWFVFVFLVIIGSSYMFYIAIDESEHAIQVRTKGSDLSYGVFITIINLLTDLFASLLRFLGQTLHKFANLVDDCNDYAFDPSHRGRRSRRHVKKLKLYDRIQQLQRELNASNVRNDEEATTSNDLRMKIADLTEHYNEDYDKLAEDNRKNKCLLHEKENCVEGLVHELQGMRKGMAINNTMMREARAESARYLAQMEHMKKILDSSNLTIANHNLLRDKTGQKEPEFREVTASKHAALKDSTLMITTTSVKSHPRVKETKKYQRHYRTIRVKLNQVIAKSEMLQMENDSLKTCLQQQKDALERAAHEKQVERVSLQSICNEKDQLRVNSVSLTNALQQRENALQQALRDIEVEKGSLHNVNQQIHQLQATETNLARHLQQAQNECVTLKAANGKLQTQVTHLKEAKASQDKVIEALQQPVHSSEKELSARKEVTSDLAGPTVGNLGSSSHQEPGSTIKPVSTETDNPQSQLIPPSFGGFTFGGPIAAAAASTGPSPFGLPPGMFRFGAAGVDNITTPADDQVTTPARPWTSFNGARWSTSVQTPALAGGSVFMSTKTTPGEYTPADRYAAPGEQLTGSVEEVLKEGVAPMAEPVEEGEKEEEEGEEEEEEKVDGSHGDDEEDEEDEEEDDDDDDDDDDDSDASPARSSLARNTGATEFAPSKTVDDREKRFHERRELEASQEALQRYHAQRKSAPELGYGTQKLIHQLHLASHYLKAVKGDHENVCATQTRRRDHLHRCDYQPRQIPDYYRYWVNRIDEEAEELLEIDDSVPQAQTVVERTDTQHSHNKNAAEDLNKQYGLQSQ